MIRKNKWQLIITSVIILLPIAAGLLIWNDLPEQMAVHWGADGEPNRWSSRSFAVFGIPFILLAVQWICTLFTACDPKNKNQSRKVYSMILWFLPVISLIAYSFTYANALGYDVDNVMIPCVLLGIVFVIVGNYMPKCKQNHTIGIKVPWTLHNEENWNRTHRFAGKVWMLGGFLLLASLLIPIGNFIYIVLPVILFIAFAPIIYSYIYYRKQIKA